MDRFVGFDLEIAEPFPEGGWDKRSSLGISCAAIYGESTMAFFPAPHNSERLPDRMSAFEARLMVDELLNAERRGAQIVTWNGLGFDFLVLAIECQNESYAQLVREMALRHIDPFFNMFCDMGYGIGLQTAANALNVHGKLEGMHGSLAPLMWNASFPATDEETAEMAATGFERGSIGAQNLCIEYVEQDAKATYDVYMALAETHNLYWTTRAGKRSRYPWRPRKLFGRLLTCSEASMTEEPNTSWMTDREPPKRSEYIGWALNE